MKRFLVVCCLMFSACAPKSLSPAAQVAYTADQVVIRLGEVQNAVIAACRAGAGPTCAPDAPIQTPAARRIVEAIVVTTQCLKAAPQGIQACANAAWTTARLTPELQAPSVKGYTVAIDVLLGVN